MSATSYAERNNLNTRLQRLESADIAALIHSELNTVQKIISDTGARIENAIIELVFINRLKKILKQAETTTSLESLTKSFRENQSEGKLAGLSMAAAADDGLVRTPEFIDTMYADRKMTKKRKPILLYAACGGFILPPSPKQKSTAERLAKACKCELELAEHRFAPENPFPAAPIDVANQYEKLLTSGRSASEIIVGGDTSGAAIALSAVIELRNREIPLPAGILLFSPWADLSLSGWSYITQSISSTSPYRMEIAAFCARLYLQEILPTDPMASPAFADFSGFPPIAVHASRYDMRFDDAIKIIENAKKANVPCRINYWDSPRHHLERFNSRDARKSLELAAEFVVEIV